MWIIPKTLPAYRYVADMGGLSLDSNELARMSEQSLMWRSKPSLVRTWLQRWNRVSWMSHLFGRILKPSMDDLFVEKYTSLLPAIPVSRLVSQESEKEQMTPDTFGRILRESLKQLDLFGSSEKMSADTLLLDSPKFTEAYEIWVTQLRQSWLVRASALPRTKDSDCLFWRSPAEPDDRLTNKVMQQANWPTPRAVDDQDGTKAYLNLQGKWREKRIKTGQEAGAKLCNAVVGLLDQDSPNTNGKSRELWSTPESRNQKGYHNQKDGTITEKLGTQAGGGKLNPDWVEQLMGLPAGWTDCDYSATELSPSRRKKRSDT